MSEPAAEDERLREPEGAPPPDERDEEDEEESSGVVEALAEKYLDPAYEAIEADDAARLEEIVEELHPADVADLLGLLEEEEREKMIEMLGGELDAEVLAELDADVKDSVIL
ncbi:MAG: hypothetical protein KDA48_12435, partial [Amphiplicatus sp.]|nr:hypothetical protein [Amphiplicatus sp.]